jgi:hypothetical protein
MVWCAVGDLMMLPASRSFGLAAPVERTATTILRQKVKM